MAIRAHVEGVEQLKRRFDTLGREVQNNAVQRASLTAAQGLEGAIVRSIQQGPASGKPRGDGSVASAPGEYPMSDTGNLAGMVNAEAERNGAAVISRAPHSAALEFRPASRGGRPFMRRGLLDFRRNIFAAFLAAMRRIV